MRGLTVVLLVSGCASGPRPDSDTACRVAAQYRSSYRPLPDPKGRSSARLSPKDLFQISVGTPVEGTARSAYAQRISAQALGGLGAAALVAGFVMGFATDPGAQDARTAGYSIIGGAIGIGVLSLTLAATGLRAQARGEAHLYHYTEGCSAPPRLPPAPPTPPVPPEGSVPPAALPPPTPPPAPASAP